MNIFDEVRESVEKNLSSEIRLEDAEKRSEELSKEREFTERLDKEYAQGKRSDKIFK